MIEFLKKILFARSVAAVLSLMTAVVALSLLPSREYASAAVGTATAAIAVAIFYFPFSKFVLISRDPALVEGLFWRSQPLFATFTLIFSLGWGAWVNWPLRFACSVALLAISQGWKEFAGEALRTRRRTKELTTLYVGDAVTTLTLTTLALYFFRFGEIWLIFSASSSIIWSLQGRASLVGAVENRTESISILGVYRYSVGVVGSSSLNASVVAMARTAILANSPMATAGAIQFMLDFLQKPMALFASSTSSAAVPEARREGVDKLKVYLIPLMGAAFAGMAAVALLAEFIPLRTFAVVRALSLDVVFACVLLVWMNRFKSCTLELPIVCSESSTRMLLAGATVSLLLMWCVSRFSTGITSTIYWAVGALLVGGIINGLLAVQLRLCRGSYLWFALCLVLIVCTIVVTVPIFVVTQRDVLLLIGTLGGIAVISAWRGVTERR